MKQLFTLLLCLSALPLLAQSSFTDRYQRFRPYHYQTSSAWNRIRREVATGGKEKWATMETEPLTMTLAGGWSGLIPSPTPANTHFFKEVEDMGRIYSLMLSPDSYGYAVYPFKLEEQFKLSENELLVPRIIAKGFMNTLITDVPYETGLKLDEIVYTSDSTQTDASTPPEVFDEYGPMGWLRDAEYYDLYNVKQFYCYFDNRPDTLRHSVAYTTRVTKQFGNEVATLTRCMEQSDLSYVCIPYWMTDVYLQVPPAVSRKIQRWGYPGYIIEPTSGTPQLINNWNSVNVMDFAPYKDLRYDLVAYCGDASSTNLFLTNRQACRRFIHTVFGYPNGMINRAAGTHKPDGLNLYLPAFDFREKRALTQLVKSISLVIDSLRVNDSVHVYSNVDFSLTFARRAAVEHSGFISGLQCFVDTVYFADFDSLGLARQVVYNNGSIDTSSVFTRVTNPFYLLRIPYKTIKPGENDADIWQLMDCDYASGQWGLFLCIDLCIVLLLIAIVVMHLTSVPFNVYAEKYRMLLVLLLITLGMEFVVFFFFTIEALSPQIIFFNLETDSLTYLALIALPVLPILLYLLLLQLNKREPVP